MFKSIRSQLNISRSRLDRMVERLTAEGQLTSEMTLLIENQRSSYTKIAKMLRKVDNEMQRTVKELNAALQSSPEFPHEQIDKYLDTDDALEVWAVDMDKLTARIEYLIKVRDRFKREAEELQVHVVERDEVIMDLRSTGVRELLDRVECARTDDEVRATVDQFLL